MLSANLRMLLLSVTVIVSLNTAACGDPENQLELAPTSTIPVGRSLLPPVEFTADRPFIFLIRVRETGAVLFMGQVLDPSA